MPRPDPRDTEPQLFGESALDAPAKEPMAHHASASDVPLAERMRPQRIDEVVGQTHLLGPGKPLTAALESGKPHSMLFWGPPGVGKTTLARLLTSRFDADFVAISAVLGGVKDIREAIERAQANRAAGRSTILFVDEVHRFNKSQQDAFLPHVESGLVTFIGATTENPSFEVNNALLSRARVYVLKELDPDQLRLLLTRAAALLEVSITEPAAERLAGLADGDARRMLNALEVAANSVSRAPGSTRQPAIIDETVLDQALAQDLRRFDKGGDAFYDQISALHKSVRGSDPDAALYWLARMLDGGADPRYLARRIVRMAIEDIGLADVRALPMALDAAQTWERLGSPEGDLALAQAVVFLSCAAKSNSVYKAFNEARAFVQEHGSAPVPLHLRNAPTRLMKSLDYGKGYRYAHDEPDGIARGERYLPDGVDVRFYHPTDRGLEAAIAEKLRKLRD